MARLGRVFANRYRVFTISKFQFSYPTADAAAGSWTTAPLFSKVNEANPNDSDFITSETLSAPGNTSNADLTLGALSTPITPSPAVIRIRALDTLTLGTAGSINVELREGSNLRATLTASLTTSFAEYTYTLTSGEAASISNYANLFFRIYGTFAVGNLGGVSVSWVILEVPWASVPSGQVNGTGAINAGFSLTGSGSTTVNGTGVINAGFSLVGTGSGQTSGGGRGGAIPRISHRRGLKPGARIG